MMLTAYPVMGKRKSFDICLAWVRGCNGQIGTKYRGGGAAFFYGVDDSNRDVWEQVLANKDEFYYCDNAYFDSTRQQQYRVTKNRLQHIGMGLSDCKRFEALGIPVKPWLNPAPDGHVVVCPQSSSFMKTLANFSDDWTALACASLRQYTERELRVRKWSSNKAALSATLEQDLQGAHCLVTWSSAAAVTAILNGVPVIVDAADCAAKIMSGTHQGIEAPVYGPRENWLGVLADNQWTMAEFTSGFAWRAING